jgi:hypothetical protein
MARMSEDGGHSLAGDGGGIEILEQSTVAMAVHVDEAGRETSVAWARLIVSSAASRSTKLLRMTPLRVAMRAV